MKSNWSRVNNWAEDGGVLCIKSTEGKTASKSSFWIYISVIKKQSIIIIIIIDLNASRAMITGLIN